MDITAVDQVVVNFKPGTIPVINVAIGFMMLGVSLDLRMEDFKRIIRSPKAPAIGLAAQFLLLPAFTYLLTRLLPASLLSPSMALGMILIAACPGGNLSNIITYLAKGNTAVSISMTAVSSIVAIFMTPLNLAFWGNMHPETALIMREVSLSPKDVFFTVFIILGIPVILGVVLNKSFPALADKVRRPFKIFSLVFFITIVIGALVSLWDVFLAVINLVLLVVFFHNLLALMSGYLSSKLFGLNARDSRAVCIEVGIQNSALGLVLVFNFFEGLGGMAIIASWWGIWHIIAGLTVSFVFTRFKLPDRVNPVRFNSTD